MEPRIVTAQEIEAIVGSIDFRAALHAMFVALGQGQAVQPPQTLALFPAGAGDFITYLGVLAGENVFGAKLSPYIPTASGALVTAWTVLMSMETGAPLLLCDAKRLTTERTAATTALAVDALARRDAGVLAIIGTGPVGLAHLRHAQRLRPWRAIRLAGRPGSARTGIPETAGEGIAVKLFADPAEAAAGADVVMLCTSSGTPVIDIAAAAPGTLITSISTNAPRAHEIDPGLLAGLEVYCDYRATTPSSAGEMTIAAEQHGWDPQAIMGDLPELLNRRAAPPSGARPVFFRSIGLGLEDVAAALAVLKRLRA